MDCDKILKSQMDAPITPSKPITMYDPSDDEESLRELGMLYDNRLLQYRGRVVVVLLAKAFVSCYGQWISHRGLRHALLTHLLYAPNEIRSLEHSIRAYQYLRQKLDSQTEIDDADLCISFLLTICPFPNNFRPNSNGSLLIMKCLSERSGKGACSSPLSVLWPLIRDEIISEALIRDAGDYTALRAGFEEVLGPENIHQREKYKRDISFGECSGSVRKYVRFAGTAYGCDRIVLYCHWRILRFKAYAEPIDSFIHSILGNTTGSSALWIDVDLPPLDPNFQNLPELLKEFNGTTAEHARNDRLLQGICEFYLYNQLLLLSTAVMDGSSICERLRSQSSIFAMTSLRNLLVQLEKSFQQEEIGKRFPS